MSDLRSILQAVYDQRGELTPAALVEEARPDDHPLHHRFEWDDSKAGEAYRRVQAAQIIRAVRITYSDAPEKHVRGFLAVRRDPSDETGAGNTYAPTEDVLNNPLTRALILREFDREWKAFKARYQHLREFADHILTDLEEAS